jgi:hypothetical protein
MAAHSVATLLPLIATTGVALAMVLAGLEKKQLGWKRPRSTGHVRRRGPFEWLRRRG